MQEAQNLVAQRLIDSGVQLRDYIGGDEVVHRLVRQRIDRLQVRNRMKIAAGF